MIFTIINWFRILLSDTSNKLGNRKKEDEDEDRKMLLEMSI